MPSLYGRSSDSFVYRYAAGLWVVTAYYNPSGYRTRRVNYDLFRQALQRSGIPVLTVECAFGDQPFDLPSGCDVIQVRGKTVLWQKERLLNLGIACLPASCRYVAWLDCDLLFLNPYWTQETVARLQDVPLVQVFERCHLLPRDAKEPGVERPSFTNVVTRNPAILTTGRRAEEHGQTGYGWAARREWLGRHGLYEFAIAGSADHFMAHAAMADFRSPCLDRQMLRLPAVVDHFMEWARPFGAAVSGRVGTVPGEVLHLWHGDRTHRRYLLRHVELTKLGFNPYQDIVDQPGKPLELKHTQPELAAWLQSYFDSRLEDGEDAALHGDGRWQTREPSSTSWTTRSPC